MARAEKLCSFLSPFHRHVSTPEIFHFRAELKDAHFSSNLFCITIWTSSQGCLKKNLIARKTALKTSNKKGWFRYLFANNSFQNMQQKLYERKKTINSIHEGYFSKIDWLEHEFCIFGKFQKNIFVWIAEVNNQSKMKSQLLMISHRFKFFLKFGCFLNKS